MIVAFVRCDVSSSNHHQQAHRLGGEDQIDVDKRIYQHPNDGLQVAGKNKYMVKYAASGTQQTKTVQVRNANGTFNVFSVETQKSDQIPPAQVPKESSDKPK